jgi:pimeloyl-ACP methyl ester carboxylesterase
MREGFVRWRAGRTWYRVVGEPGQIPLLCLHGGPGSTHHYFGPLERLADERQVVVYDQLGCGASDRPENVEWSFGLFLEELDAVRAAIGLEEVHLLGTSWGGMLALEHTLACQPTVVSLVLSSSLASAAEWTAEVKRLLDAIALDDDAARARELGARHVYRGEDRPELRAMRAERSALVYEAMWGPNEWTVVGALRGWDVRDRLDEIRIPTLVLRGAYDLSTPAIAKTLLDGIPQAKEVVFEHSSHVPVLEETDRYVAAVRAFLHTSDRNRVQG